MSSNFIEFPEVFLRNIDARVRIIKVTGTQISSTISQYPTMPVLNKVLCPEPAFGFEGAIKHIKSAMANKNPSIAQNKNRARFQKLWLAEVNLLIW